MDSSLARQIAEQVVNQQILLNWKFYGLVLLLSAAGYLLAQWLSGYAKKRGETAATKADFEQLLDQQKALTASTEAIRSAVSADALKAAEYRGLRREKLEQLLLACLETRDWPNELSNERVYSDPPPVGKNLQDKVYTIAKLYFRELRSEVSAFDTACDAYQLCLNGIKKKLLQARLDNIELGEAAVFVAQHSIRDAASGESLPHCKNLYRAMLALREHAAALISEIIRPETA